MDYSSTVITPQVSLQKSKSKTFQNYLKASTSNLLLKDKKTSNHLLTAKPKNFTPIKKVTSYVDAGCIERVSETYYKTSIICKDSKTSQRPEGCLYNGKNTGLFRSITPVDKKGSRVGAFDANRESAIGIPGSRQTIDRGLEGQSTLGTKNRKLEDFEFIGKTLGQGCNATVRKAVDKYTKEVVAIKTYNRMKISDAIKKKSIMYEIDVLKMLDHKNLTKCHYTFENVRNIHIIMDLAGNSNLKQVQSRRDSNRFCESETQWLLLQILEGVNFLHDNHICHRDIKLENLMVNFPFPFPNNQKPRSPMTSN